MNFKTIYITLLGILILSGISCKKFLNQMPNDTLPIDSMFSNLANTNGALAQIYAKLPDPYVNNRTVTGGHDGYYNYIADDGNYYAQTGFLALQFNNSQMTSTFTVFNYIWPEFYKKVRSATYFIDNIDGANAAEVSTFLKGHYKGEARALRAIFYFWMLRLYGPVIILPENIPVDGSNDEILKARTPFDSCVSYITTQLDSAYDEINAVSSSDHPGDQPYNQEYGRITTGICKAYKTQVLMLAASPLFNGNTAYKSVTNQDGTPLFSQTYDQNKWKIAADALKDFIDEFVPSTYSLFTEANADPYTAAYLACRDVVNTDWNSEWIFGTTLCTDVGSYVNQCTPKLVGYGTTVTKGAGFYSASQKIVDAYFMKNGRPITDPLSEYVSSGFSNFQSPFDIAQRSTYNQWVNREPRFYVGITYNNSYWLGQGSSTTPVLVNMEYHGNSGKIQSITDVSSTGYVVRKNVTLSTSNRGWVCLRLAQIYLDYAEALNEYDPGNPDILKYVNLVRVRAGIAPYGDGADDIPAPTTQASVRDIIHHERQVELAFEDVRYFDLRRWKEAGTALNTSIYGMNMDGDSTAFYQKTIEKNIKFQQRDYLWAIPSSEIRVDAKLVQNPGW